MKNLSVTYDKDGNVVKSVLILAGTGTPPDPTGVQEGAVYIQYS